MRDPLVAGAGRNFALVQHELRKRCRNAHGDLPHTAARFALSKRERIHNRIGELLFILHYTALVAFILAYPCAVDNDAVLSVRAANQAYNFGTANIQHGSILTHGASVRAKSRDKVYFSQY